LIEADNGIEIQAMLNAFKHDFGSNTVESLPIKKKREEVLSLEHEKCEE
jgi:hypothetical protein